MNREEALQRLKTTDACDSELCKALEMAIKALEQEPCEVSQGLVKDSQGFSQEPCEDCISREKALEALWDEWTEYDSELIDWLYDKIDKLPSVTPQHKMGYWFIDERPESNREIICSNCEQPIFKFHKLDFDYRPHYCPNCGAKMQEVEE